jgi:hypothetical protein
MLSNVRIGGARGRATLAFLLIAGLATGCGGSASVGGPVAGPAGTAAPAPQLGGSERDLSGEVEYAAGQADLLIIKTGSLAIQVTGIDQALTAANQQISVLGGYAGGSERSGDGDAAQATITYRVPAARWDEALAGLRGLATKILQERTSTQDVTDQVVDLGARIRNLNATERALQSIMDRATEIKDVLAVQAELTKVRGEIEQLTAQKTNLEAQAAFSTLTVTFALKPNPVLTSQEKFDPAAEVDAASASLVSVLQGLATAGIWFAIVWLPILLAIAVLIAIGVFVYRRLRPAGAGDETRMPAPGA